MNLRNMISLLVKTVMKVVLLMKDLHHLMLFQLKIMAENQLKVEVNKSIQRCLLVQMINAYHNTQTMIK